MLFRGVFPIANVLNQLGFEFIDISRAFQSKVFEYHGDLLFIEGVNPGCVEIQEGWRRLRPYGFVESSFRHGVVVLQLRSLLGRHCNKHFLLPGQI